MLFLLAVLFPPLAVAVCATPAQAVFNLLLTLLLFVPGVLHALWVVQHYYSAARRHHHPILGKPNPFGLG